MLTHVHIEKYLDINPGLLAEWAVLDHYDPRLKVKPAMGVKIRDGKLVLADIQNDIMELNLVAPYSL